MLLPQRVERGQRSALGDVPEGPTIARRRPLKCCSHLVDGAGVSVTGNGAVRAHGSSPASLRIREGRARRHQAALDENPERYPWLLALVYDSLHSAFVERQGRSDPLARD